MKNLFVIASLTACLASGYALAGQSGSASGSAENPATHKEFLKLDTNKDGYIESKEAKHNTALNHDFANVAKNGKLNEAEFSAWEVRQTETAKPGHETGKMPADPMKKPATGGSYE
jgi:hypothetical protein